MRGSRPTWARTASRRRSGIASAALASIGSTGGSKGSAIGKPYPRWPSRGVAVAPASSGRHWSVARASRARSRPRFQAAGLAYAGSWRARPVASRAGCGCPASPPRGVPAGPPRGPGRRRRAARRGRWRRAPRGRRAGPGSGRGCVRRSVAPRTPAGATRLSPTSATTPMTARPCPSHCIRPAQRERDHDHERGAQRDDRRQHVQPQLGPAVGVLVEPETERRRHEHDRGQADEREEQRRGTAGCAARRSSRGRPRRRPRGTPPRRARRSRAGRSRCRSGRRRRACSGRRTGRRPGGRRRARPRGRR